MRHIVVTKTQVWEQDLRDEDDIEEIVDLLMADAGPDFEELTVVEE